jgi:hypothetical protein
MADPRYLVKKAVERLDAVIDSPMVPKEELVPMMNELAAIVGHLYLAAHDAENKEEARKIKDLIKGLEGLIGTLKYQYRSYTDFKNYWAGEAE